MPIDKKVAGEEGSDKEKSRDRVVLYIVSAI